MNLSNIFSWGLFVVALGVIGFKTSPLLNLSRGIDNLRAGIRCSGLCYVAARDEWVRQWESCQHWVRRER